MSSNAWPSVTVVAINHDGKDFLAPCLQSVLDQEYDGDIEIILIDNASKDGSRELVRKDFPTVQVIANSENTGFAPAVNQGAKAAEGEIIALINNDAFADRYWLRELVRPMLTHDDVACTGGLVLDEEGKTVDFAGGAASFSGHGFPLGHGEPPRDDLRMGPTLFGTGASLAVRAKVFHDVGGMDEDYFAYFEDVDFGWRLWLLGYQVWFCPESVLFHHHGGTIKKYGNFRERYLLERNALFTIFKNLADDRLARAFPASVALSLLRALEEEGTELGDFRIGPDTAGTTPTIEISPMSAAHLAALRDFSADLPKWREKRAWVQSKRAREDREVMRLLRNPVGSAIPSDTYKAILDEYIKTFDLLAAATSQQRVLVICADTVGEKMAGPAIRAWEMCTLLSREHEVVLGTLSEPGRTSDLFAVEHLAGDRMARRVDWAEIIVVQGVTMWWYPEIVDSNAVVVADIYDPFHIEALEQRRNEPHAERWATAKSDVAVINQQLRRGDLLLCASDKQRDFWLGMLAAVGRINPATYDMDPDLRALIEVAPFGMSSTPPTQKRHAIKGVVKGIAEDDIVLLWGGGIYNWFDPVTLIRAVARAAEEEPRLKLFFLGTAHPNPDIPAMYRAAEAYREAERLGVLGKHVFFNDEGWVAYDERADYLLDADIGVSLHFLHIETELSFRTRILDYLWAGLPTLCTEGDGFAHLIEAKDLGEVVKANNVDDVAAGILRLADPARRAAVSERVRAFAPTMTWERALEPLLAFCRNPHRAPDIAISDRPYVDISDYAAPSRSPAYLAKRFAQVVTDKGPGHAMRMVRETVQRSARVRDSNV